jgi:UDP-N-acetylmuramate--alanine ligase
MNKKIYIIWIWGIWISAIARYYMYLGYDVFWSDSTNSELIEKLIEEWCNIIIWSDKNRIDETFEKVVYTEAIPENNEELQKTKELWIKILTYPEALAGIVNNKKLIAVSWTHGKSTTTSLISLVLKDSETWINSIVWTILKEFENKNTYFSSSPNFVIEACEYKRSFLKYTPSLLIITNIEIDHLDYYKNLEDYISAYEQLINNIKTWWFVIINALDKNSKSLIWKRDDINYILAYENHFSYNGQEFLYPNIDIKIPWKHILFDAKISYIVWYMMWLKDEEILKKLSVYNGVWRRMERIWETVYNNILLSDYGHHPTEISLTLESIKKSNIDKKILTIFQPHQYNRTLELLDWFKNCFWNTDILIIPDIYESRDSKEDREKINSKKLIELINHKNKFDWDWMKNTLKLIKKYDKENPEKLIILLLWAGNVDDLRYQIEMK